MRIWLTGAGGNLGSVLCARLEALGSEFVATDRSLDIGDLTAVSRFVEKEQPTLIVNAAAYTLVDEAETHEDEAFRANALGPENLGRLAAQRRASVLHFSTDYVFDGRSNEPYREEAPTAPLGAYARTKREGERRLLAVTGGHSMVVRASWLFADAGASFVQRILDLAAVRDELRVVEDQRGRPTYAPDLADAALRLVGLVEPERHPASARPYGVYHFANRGETTRHAFAEAIVERARALGLPVRTSWIVPVKTAEFPPLPAMRPAYSVLATEKIEAALGIAPRPWQAALDDFFSARAASR
jgi:dTDP-4-dehydrorhamnose reductase